MPSKKSQAFDTLFQSIVDPPEVGVGQDQVEGLVPLDASNIEDVTSEFDRIRQEEDPSMLDRFSEFFTPLVEKGRKNSRYLAPKSEAIVRMSDPEVLSLLEPRMERATKSEMAKSIMPAPGKFFNPASQGYKGEKFATGLQSAGVDVDLEYGNYVMFGDGRPKDVTNQTFQNLYVSPRTSYKYSAGQNKATARANPYDGPTLTVEEMQKNYKQNTGAAGSKIQTNLLQPSQFKIKTSSDQTRTLDHPIVAVEGKGKHHYALDMQMVGPVRMNQLTKKVKRKKKDGTVVEELPQPNLRPATVGDVILGDVIGYITVQGNDHPLYDYIEVDGTSSAPDEMKSSSIEKFYKGGSVEATGDMTTQGREVFREGEVQYSEKTVTFQMKDGKWVTIPSVDKEGNEMPQEALEKFVEENGPVDPVTGAELPTFDSVEQATEYAVQRSQDLMPPMPTTLAEMYHGGLMGGKEGASECGCASCQMKKMMNYVQEDMSSMFAPLSGMGMVGIDPVSGNEVPAGSGPDNVRDDIPAVLSDGEYVVPADVVRYHGLKHLEQMRQEAKMGLMAMMMEGQIQTIEEEEEAYSKSAMEGEQEVELSEEDAEDGEGYETYETPEGVEVDQPEVKVTSSGMMMFKPVKKLAFMRT